YLVRPTLVRVEALKENGEKTVINGTGFMAKCLCHEIDHLSGIVFSDRVTEWLPDEEV
ncbi:MAG: peptide deformylase, partial [Clostridiales bacterium]|nr:peptide deformylase [Clostridiales bacterium]